MRIHRERTAAKVDNRGFLPGNRKHLNQVALGILRNANDVIGARHCRGFFRTGRIKPRILPAEFFMDQVEDRKHGGCAAWCGATPGVISLVDNRRIHCGENGARQERIEDAINAAATRNRPDLDADDFQGSRPAFEVVIHAQWRHHGHILTGHLRHAFCQFVEVARYAAVNLPAENLIVVGDTHFLILTEMLPATFYFRQKGARTL